MKTSTKIMIAAGATLLAGAAGAAFFFSRTEDEAVNQDTPEQTDAEKAVAMAAEMAERAEAEATN